MPDDAIKLEQAVAEQWPLARVAKELEVDADNAAALMESTRKAMGVVQAENPAESFRESVRQVVEKAVTEGFDEAYAIDDLVTQICYRASDLAYLLNAEGTRLSRYSRHLRRERDHGYYEGYFDEED